MITHGNNRVTLTGNDSLPELPSVIQRLYIDVETTSGNPKVKALNPFLGHKTAGFAITWDDHPIHYYLPVRHNNALNNMPLVNVVLFIREAVKRCRSLRNHSLKFDMHFLANDGVDFGYMHDREYVCLLVRAKLLDSERQYGRGGYDLTGLAADWLKVDITPWEAVVKQVLGRMKSHDYGDCPIDLMGDYATVDIATARRLDQYIDTRIEEDMKKILDIETKLTPVLFDIEREGLAVNTEELVFAEAKTLARCIKIEERIEQLTGTPIRPQANEDCRALFCDQYDLPVLVYTKAGRPSFNYAALKGYETLPQVIADPKISEVIGLILEFKDKYTFLNMFVKPYQLLQRNGRIHPQYNQSLTTGRLGCKQPNAQQLSFEARELIHPDDGCAFLSGDYSQIEFRCIAHYINSQKIIADYAENPDQDFHTWVAEMCGIPRDPAKNVNFAVGYGAGLRKVLMMLAANKELHKLTNDELTALIAGGSLDESDRAQAFESRIKARAKSVYDSYHNVLFTLKPTMKDVERVCKQRGYVRTWYGRRRHLTAEQAWRGFNAICQGTAADIAKEKLVELSPRFNEKIRRDGITQAATVHDEILFKGEKKLMQSPETIYYIGKVMETISKPLRIPMRVSFGSSEKHWAEAAKLSDIDRTAWGMELIDEE